MLVTLREGEGCSKDLFLCHACLFQNVIMGGTTHYPVSNQFMIGDYVMPTGTVVLQTQQPAHDNTKKVSS
jgi:hypothetical protein